MAEAGTWTPDVSARLAVLRSELEKPGVDRIELAIPALPVPCFLGADVGGSTWIRVSCKPSSVSVDDKAAAVTFNIGADGYRVLLAAGTDRTVLGHFFEEVLELIGSGHAPGDAGCAALQQWRELLAKPPGSKLSQQALVGLFGELEVLETILRLGGSLEYWTGWNRDHCDFRLPHLVIEVKSTTSSDYRRVRIHGLSQLADPEDGSDLVLVLRRLESSTDGRSVPELIDANVRCGASRSVLLERLSQVGYHESHRQEYERIKFVSDEVALRRIDSSHPRLTAAILTDVDLSCIDKIDYELNLNGRADADIPLGLEDLLGEHLAR